MDYAGQTIRIGNIGSLHTVRGASPFGGGVIDTVCGRSVFTPGSYGPRRATVVDGPATCATCLRLS